MRKAKSLKAKGDLPASLRVFWGEYLASPIPLELSLNYCSHSCAFCFANLNAPERKANVPQAMGLLSDLPNRRSPEALLLRAGYPVLISNKVDPFAASNWRQSVPLMETLTEMGIPIAIQTRGGRGIDEVLSFLPPSCWYISICQVDDDLRKRIEPGAPSLEERWTLIDKLKAKGHEVLLAVNPIVPEWVPDPYQLFRRAKDAGVHGTWAEPLHFNQMQEERLVPRERLALTEDIIRRARARRLPDEMRAVWQAALHEAQEAGLETYHIGQAAPSKYWEPYRRLYPKTFPLMQDFVNWAYAEKEPGDVLRYEDFEAVMLDRFPDADVKHPINNYIGAKKPALCRDQNIPNQLTYRQVLAFAWKTAVLNYSPAQLACFAMAATKDPADQMWETFVDGRGLPFYIFTPNGVVDPADPEDVAAPAWLCEAADAFTTVGQTERAVA